MRVILFFARIGLTHMVIAKFSAAVRCGMPTIRYTWSREGSRAGILNRIHVLIEITEIIFNICKPGLNCELRLVHEFRNNRAWKTYSANTLLHVQRLCRCNLPCVYVMCFIEMQSDGKDPSRTIYALIDKVTVTLNLTHISKRVSTQQKTIITCSGFVLLISRTDLDKQRNAT